MDGRLAAALRPVLHDLGTLGGLAPHVIDEPWQGIAGQMTAYLTSSTGKSVGISAMVPDNEARRTASLADQIQDWAVEALWKAGLPAVWPECPLHPHGHPLKPSVSGDRAIWVCPQLGQEIAVIGSFPGGGSNA